MGKAARPLPQTETVQVNVGQIARDHIALELQVSDGEIVAAKLTGVGCRELLELLATTRPQLHGKLAELKLPIGTGHAAILLREAIMKARGEWSFPYEDDEICHCRAVATAKVDAAVVGGCHTIDRIKRATSASTSCGTCRTDIERVIGYRMGK